MMKAVKCKNCGKRLFDIAAVGKIETKCSKCGRIVTIDISLDSSGKIKMIQKIA
jgi:phage FluMu protein Com